MIVKLLLKIAFKACLPLVAMVGIVSYMLYMNGGDPLSMGKQMISSMDFGKSATNATSSITGTFDAIGSKVGASPGGAKKGSTVYKWVDAAGVTQYGSAPPEDATGVTAIKLKKGPAPEAIAPTTAAATPNAPVDTLPGMAGVKLPGGVKLPAGVDYSRILGHINEGQ